MDLSKNRLGMPTKGDKEYFNKMRNMNININPGLPIEKAPGMRKKYKKTKSKSPRKKTKSKSPRKKTPTKKQLMSDMYKRAKKDIPFLKNPKNRKEYVQKLKTIPMKKLRSMNPMDVVNYVPQFSQTQNLQHSDLGQSLVRTNRRSIDRPRI
tara:strand:+ start:5342 stop:5797 length:456 start_codon:yes stop_codon:yes gene_type:complete